MSHYVVVLLDSWLYYRYQCLNTLMNLMMYPEGSLQDRPDSWTWVNASPGIRKVNCVFEVDVKKPNHRTLPSLQYPKTCADFK